MFIKIMKELLSYTDIKGLSGTVCGQSQDFTLLTLLCLVFFPYILNLSAEAWGTSRATESFFLVVKIK